MLNITETISLLEAIWTPVSLIGVGFSIFALKDVLNDREDVLNAREAAHEGPLSTEQDDIIVNQGVRNERMNLILLLGFALAGLAALAIPNRVPQDTYIEIARTGIGLILLSLNIGVVHNVWKNRQDRKKLLSGNVAKVAEANVQKGRDEGKKSRDKFQTDTAKTLDRLEKAGAESVIATKKVAKELKDSQQRADAVDGEPGEAGDEASRSKSKRRQNGS